MSTRPHSPERVLAAKMYVEILRQLLLAARYVIAEEAGDFAVQLEGACGKDHPVTRAAWDEYHGTRTGLFPVHFASLSFTRAIQKAILDQVEPRNIAAWLPGKRQLGAYAERRGQKVYYHPPGYTTSPYPDAVQKSPWGYFIVGMFGEQFDVDTYDTLADAYSAAIRMQEE